LRRVVVFMCPGVPGTVCSGGLGRIQGRGCRGKGPYRVGGVILERRIAVVPAVAYGVVVDAGWICC